MLAQLCSHPRPCTKTNSQRNPPEQAERSPFKAFQGSASSFSSSSAGRALLPPGAGSWGARKEKKNTTEHSTAGYGALGGGWEGRGGPVLRAYSGRRAAGGAQGGSQPLQLRRQLLAGRDAGAEVALPGLQQAPQPPQPLHLRAAENSGSRRGRASRAGPGASRCVPLRPSLRPAAPTRRGSGSLPPAASIAEPPAGLAAAACVAMATAAGNAPRLLPGGGGRGCSDAEGAGWGGKGRGGGTGTGTGTGTWTGAGPRL